MRKVEYYERKTKPNGDHYNELIGEAKFLCFGVKNGNTSAIIELDDGTVKNILVVFIKFIDDDDEVKTVDTVNIPGNNDKLYYNPDECCIHQCQNCISGNLVPKTVDKFFCTDCGLLNDNLWKHVDEEEKTVNVVNSPDFNVKVYRANECIYLCENCLSPNSVIRTADYFKCDCGHLNNKLLECDYQCRYCSTYNEVLKTDKMFKCSNCENVNDSLWTYIKYRD